MKNHHIYWLAFGIGAAAGFFVLTNSNCYGSGQWGNSTFGWVYGSGAKVGL